MVRLLVFCTLTCLLLADCQPDHSYRAPVSDPEFLHRAHHKLTDIIVYDIFSPPVASRNYVYPSIAAYETVRQAYQENKSLAGQLRNLKPIPAPKDTSLCNLPIAAFQAFVTVGKALIFSEGKMEEFVSEVHQEYRDLGVPKRVLETSLAYGNEVAQHILNWADEDNYKQTRTFPKFDIRDEEGRWQPTPPDYMEGIEPHWREIRPMVIDSAQQFTPPFPSPYDLSEGSSFHGEVMEVYETVNSLDEEQTEIAKFWDCNPYVSHHKGHVMFATKKITPGGHWMGIAELAAKKANADMLTSAKTYALTSIALFDAFISCWDEKYRSSLIRPETVINKHFDDRWVPLLQTPPFPEYTSGHSVISAAAGETLTAIYGDNFAFDDTVELAYGLPVRSFSSFRNAYQEAAISRLYGGIHYMPAIENGVIQGKKLGIFIINSIDL
ncbi:MAG: vanadium-dependent haloperoxidase [Saprospiraceae bacterium]|nr:vanadium-dependent haloperoxidase [Saprospiraceae bacterium]